MNKRKSRLRPARAFALSDEIRLLLGKEDDIDDVEDRERVDEEKRDEPSLMTVSSGSPQRHSFPGQSPDHKKENHLLPICG